MSDEIEYDYGDEPLEPVSKPQNDTSERPKQEHSRQDHTREHASRRRIEHIPPSLSHPEHRFFVLKCEFYSIFSQAKRTECWPARPHIAAHFDDLVRRSRHCSLTLFFTLERAKCFVGMAWVAGPGRPLGRFTEVPIRWLAVKDVGFVDVRGRLPEHVYADQGQMTIRDGVELEWEVGKAVERLFYDDSYGQVRVRRL